MTRTALVLAACCAALAPDTAVGGVEFTAGATLSTPFVNGNIAVADLDEDGHLDMVHSTTNSNPATVFRGAGDGTFDGGTPIAGTGRGGLSSPTHTTDVRWERCAPNGRKCVRAGSGPRHRVRPAERGHRLQIRVTATNAAGTTTVTSPLTSVIAAPGA